MDDIPLAMAHYPVALALHPDIADTAQINVVDAEEWLIVALRPKEEPSELTQEALDKLQVIRLDLIDEDAEELLKRLWGFYEELWPVGEHRDDQWGSAAEWLERFAEMLQFTFGVRQWDAEGNYTDERITE